jgi:ferredoxin
MVRESQFRREDAVLIGVRCGGVVKDPTSQEPLSADTVADRCPGCTIQEPAMVDHLVGPAVTPPPGRDKREELAARLEAMSFDERFAWWQIELERCVRCHACREVCPLCFCERCLADKTDPQWLESSPHVRGNLAWYMTRALHLAGRCVDCMECERVCPSDIPLTLMSRRLAVMVAELYGYSPTDDPGIPGPVGSYDANDNQEFIR